MARTRLQGVDAVFFFPFDLPPFVNRTLTLVKPRLFLMMETEIWPNLLRACRKAGVKTMLVNGRISSRSYPRYTLARGFFRRVLLDVDRFCMQSDESARRIVDIGADPARVVVTGSLKFDSLESPTSAVGRGATRVVRSFRFTTPRPVIVAGSTMKGEESAVLAAFAAVRRVHPTALLIMAPRKPERFGEAEALARAEGLRVVRRTELAVDAEPRADVVILDTIGELAHLFQVATVVFIGGSLADYGGHNILEPAVHGKPIVFGPYMQNFAEIAATFLTQQAAIQVSRQANWSCPTVLVRLIGRPRRARAPFGAGGARAGRGESRRQGAHARRDRRAPAAARWPRSRAALPARVARLHHPVISIGNIVLGGLRQDAARGPYRAAARGGRRAAGGSDARIQAREIGRRRGGGQRRPARHQ